MSNIQTTVQDSTAKTGGKHNGSDTNSSDYLSPAQPPRRRGSIFGRTLRCEDLTPRVVALFWAKVHKTDSCWLWTAYKDRNGYGLTYAGTRKAGHRSNSHYAHRIAYALAHGEAPSGKVVMHSCDNPSCVNPAHLSVGTQTENIVEREQRGRGKKTSPRIRKITIEGVREIRLTRGIVPAVFYAKRWGVCVSHINRIRRGEKRKVS